MNNTDFNCFDTVSMVVDVATERFAPLYKVDSNAYDILENYCNIIDDIMDDSGVYSLESEVDEYDMTILISFVCADFSFAKNDKNYTQLIERAVSLGFRSVDEDHIEVKFKFPSIWIK